MLFNLRAACKGPAPAGSRTGTEGIMNLRHIAMLVFVLAALSACKVARRHVMKILAALVAAPMYARSGRLARTPRRRPREGGNSSRATENGRKVGALHVAAHRLV